MSLQPTSASHGSTTEDVVMSENSDRSPQHPFLNASRHLWNWVFSNHTRALTFPINTCSREQTSPPHYPPETLQPMSRLHINALPVELLGEIFAQYTHSFLDGTPFVPEDHRRTRRRRKRELQMRFGRVSAHRTSSTNPILLGHVCGYWRALSLSMPELWSKICVTFPTTSDVPLLDMWLKRSGTSPLDLTIVHSQGRVKDDGIDDIVRLTCGQNHRWKHVTLILGEHVDHLFDAWAPSIPFPLLEGIDLQLSDWDEDIAVQLCRLMYRAPNLRRVRHNTWWKTPSVTSGIPWSVLEDVELKVLDADDLDVAFTQGLHLRSLTIHNLVGTVKRLPSDPSMLPHLGYLSIGSGDIHQILRKVELPALKELHLPEGLGGRHTSQTVPDILQEITRFSCRLEKLLVNLGHPADEDILITILQSPVMTDLKSLAIRSKATGKLLQFLTPSSSSSSPLSKLEHLILSKLYSNDGELKDMVQSHVGCSASRLRSVEVCFYTHSHAIDKTIEFPNIRMLLSTVYG
ncbi:hypothetical protein CC1G_11721 [Coprinopsis cinerea okayama7|uniref:F-box domain-containing protein n=1 Tax=Coprinopsis cinerea (strain Okayama-7 / 130 / ATCC MYA-4618 / FGSC 9003) TaxID=240176 RepID=A8NJW9_COPC7|nr:hypothetical protein CC1G_11721 [Coprinopsis cinerea okayama7\|eukprot:XP_001834312.2 hypothetical protein CC1G_11721 [Coprinopsis cinerea okayama7\